MSRKGRKDPTEAQCGTTKDKEAKGMPMISMEGLGGRDGQRSDIRWYHISLHSSVDLTCQSANKAMRITDGQIDRGREKTKIPTRTMARISEYKARLGMNTRWRKSIQKQAKRKEIKESYFARSEKQIQNHGQIHMPARGDTLLLFVFP